MGTNGDDEDDFRIPDWEGMTPHEREFMGVAERIARKVSAMSDEERDAYIKANGLEYLATPERIEAILAQAVASSRKLH